MGDLPPERELTTTLGVVPTVSHRRGELLPPRGTRRIEHDVWLVDLIVREEWCGPEADEAPLERAIATLRTMAPALAALERRQSQTELYLSSIREECQGTVHLPANLVAAAAAGGLSLDVSVATIAECGAADLAADEDDAPGDLNRNQLSLRVRATPSYLAQFVAALAAGPGGPPRRIPRDRAAALTAPDEWRLPLIGFAEWQGIVPVGPGAWYERAPDDAVMARALATLESLAPTLAGLSREQCHAALCLRSLRETDTGGY
ncbi:MAG TPA: hypothetical protein VF916_13120, partial [Ktedonobacterales bacterium]